MSIEDGIKEAMEQEINSAKTEYGVKEESKGSEEVPKTSKDTSEESSVDDGKEYTDFEREQMSKGWNPDGVKSADEYARTEPLYEELKHRGKQIKQMQKTLDELSTHMKKQEQVTYEKALATLRQERLEAIAQGNIPAVMEIEKRHDEMQKLQPVVIPEVDAFAEKYVDIFSSANYEEMEIAEFVKKRDVELMTRQLSPKDHMATLEQHMLKKFPNYFGVKEVVDRTESSVETGTGSNVSKKTAKSKYTLHDLSPEQKQVARDFEKFGIMKIDEYIKQLAQANELK